MTAPHGTAGTVDLPPLRELGSDLLRVTPRQRLLTLALPFLCCGAYFGLPASQLAEVSETTRPVPEEGGHQADQTLVLTAPSA
jgi:hypothetical protein